MTCTMHYITADGTSVQLVTLTNIWFVTFDFYHAFYIRYYQIKCLICNNLLNIIDAVYVLNHEILVFLSCNVLTSKIHMNFLNLKLIG